MVNFPTWIRDCDSYSPALLSLCLSSDASICSKMALSLLGNSDHVVVFPLTFQYTQNMMPCFNVWLMTILVLNGMVFVII